MSLSKPRAGLSRWNTPKNKSIDVALAGFCPSTRLRFMEDCQHPVFTRLSLTKESQKNIRNYFPIAQIWPLIWLPKLTWFASFTKLILWRTSATFRITRERASWHAFLSPLRLLRRIVTAPPGIHIRPASVQPSITRISKCSV